MKHLHGRKASFTESTRQSTWEIHTHPRSFRSFRSFRLGALHLDACHWCNGKAGVLYVQCFCVFNNKGRHVLEVCQVNRAVAAVETWARSDTRLCQTIDWCLCIALTMFLSIEAFTMSGHTCQVKGNLVLMLVWEALNLYSLNFFVTEHCMLSHEVVTEALRFLSCTLLCYSILTTLMFDVACCWANGMCQLISTLVA